MCEVCKTTTSGVVGRAEARRAQAQHDQKIRQEAIQSVLGQSARPRLTPTDYAQRVLAVVGGIVLLASLNFLLHALLATLAVLFAGVSATAVVVAVRRRSRAARAIPAPLPAAPPPRTVVTSVDVRAIGPSPARQGLHAPERARTGT
jgi:hypothetical protein